MSTAERGAPGAAVTRAMGVAVQLAAAEQAKCAAEVTYEQRRTVHRMFVSQNRVALGMLSPREREQVEVVAGLLGGVVRELDGGAVVVETASGARVLAQSEGRLSDARQAYERASAALRDVQRAAHGALAQQVQDLTVVRVAQAEARVQVEDEGEWVVGVVRPALDASGRQMDFALVDEESESSASTQSGVPLGQVA